MHGGTSVSGQSAVEAGAAQNIALIRRKAWQTIYLQLATYVTAGLFLWSELHNEAWSRPGVASILRLPGPLFGVACVTGAVFVLALIFIVALVLLVLQEQKPYVWTMKWANRMIIGVAGTDVMGIVAVMLMFGGSVGFLSLIATVIATIVVFTCQYSGSGQLMCRVCRRARNDGTPWDALHRKFWVWLPMGSLGARCHWLVAFGLAMYWLGINGPAVSSHAPGWFEAVVAPSRVELRPVTMMVFAVIGMGQFLYAKFSRETMGI